MLLFRCWFRQDSSIRVAGRVLPDNYGVIVVLRYAQHRRRYPVSRMQQFSQFFCKYNTVQLQPQMCANRFLKCIVPMVFVLFHLRRLNIIDYIRTPLMTITMCLTGQYTIIHDGVYDVDATCEQQIS